MSISSTDPAPRSPSTFRAGTSDPLSATPWRPGASALAFTCTLVLLGAFTRIGGLEPSGASDAVLEELHALAPVLMVAIALAHATVAAVAARMPRVRRALAVLLLSTAALPLLAEALRGPIHALLLTVAPRYSSQWPSSCPQDAWTPAVGALVGALLAPIVGPAVHLRGQPAADVGARMLWITGLWTGTVTVALRIARLAGPAPLALASSVALLCALVGFTDTVLRWVRLRSLLSSGRLIVRAPRADEAVGLVPYASLARSTPCAGVLCLDEVREASPYRAVRHGRCLALAPMDASLLVRALGLRLGWQAALLVGLIAALALVTSGG
jgi:hypothetical protein